MTWDSEACADVYNVYRYTGLALLDSDHNGVANSYGTCFQSNLEVTEVTDTTHPPAGQTDFYVVTGKGAHEGTMGYASNGMQRQNEAPCP